MMQAKSTAAAAEPETAVSAPAPDGALHILADHISEEALADELELGLRTMRRYRAQRQSPAYVVIGRKVYYRRGAVEEWLRNRERGFEEPRNKRRSPAGR
jgi:hypothetical protein